VTDVFRIDWPWAFWSLGPFGTEVTHRVLPLLTADPH
jgi:hypothetical protein